MTSTATLLEALATWLGDDLQPELTGVRAFESRIAVNLLGTLRRELELAPALARCEAAIAARHGLAPPDMSATLARALRDGQVSTDAPLIEALRQRAMLRCAIDVPRYWGLAQARQRWPALTRIIDAGAAPVSDTSGTNAAAARPKDETARGLTQESKEQP